MVLVLIFVVAAAIFIIFYWGQFSGMKKLWSSADREFLQVKKWILNQADNLFANPEANLVINQGKNTSEENFFDEKKEANEKAIIRAPLPAQSEPAEFFLPNNTIEAFSADALSSPEIKEEIFKRERPSEITEEKFNPVFPEEPQETGVVVAQVTSQPSGQGMGGGPIKSSDEEDSKLLVSSTTAIVLPDALIWLSGYGLTARNFVVNWNSSSSEIVSYDIDRKIGESDWEHWTESVSSSSRVFDVPQDETTYYFRVAGINADGLKSNWMQIQAEINFYPVVINEIAWAGTGTSTASDEWIELFNKTDEPVDLSGWNLKSATDSKPNSTTTGVIGANGYFLLERTDDDTIKDIAADQIYVGDLSNTGEILELNDQFGNLIDMVPISQSGGWLAGKGNPDYLTMERVNPYILAGVSANWQSNSSLARNGIGATGQLINGTPKAQNSVFDLGFLFLYPASSTNATSTFLKWTKSYRPGLKEYRVWRSPSLAFDGASTTIITIFKDTSFFDINLESETEYYYKILACDVVDQCSASNTVFVKTPAFLFSWSWPAIITQGDISGDATSSVVAFKIFLDAGGQINVSWSDVLADSTSSEIFVLNANSRLYKFWFESQDSGSGLYFIYQTASGQWRPKIKIIDLPIAIRIWQVLVDTNNIAHIAWLDEENNQLVYYIFGMIE